jgi:hypothetical protein
MVMVMTDMCRHSPMGQQFSNSEVQQFNNSAVQQFSNASTLQQLRNLAIPQFRNSAIQQLYMDVTIIFFRANCNNKAFQITSATSGTVIFLVADSANWRNFNVMEQKMAV